MAPPKGTPPETAAYIDLFKSIGLTQAKASEAAKSAKSAALLQGLIERHALTGGRIDEKQAGLVAALAVQGAKIREAEQGYVINAIIDGRLKSTDQVNGMCLSDPSPRLWMVRLMRQDLCRTYDSCGQVPRGASAACGR